MLGGILFMTPYGITIMKAESVCNEGARQEGLAAPLSTITKNCR